MVLLHVLHLLYVLLSCLWCDWLNNRKHRLVAAKVIYAMVFQVDSHSGWAKLGPAGVPYKLELSWDEQITVDREAYMWTQKEIIQEGKELSKLPKAAKG